MKNGVLSLDDGSEWAMGYWWPINTWEKGDKVYILTPYDLAYYFYRIDNLTKQETAWAIEAIKAPDPCYGNCLWICEIDHSTVKFNNGAILEIPNNSLKNTLRNGNKVMY